MKKTNVYPVKLKMTSHGDYIRFYRGAWIEVKLHSSSKALEKLNGLGGVQGAFQPDHKRKIDLDDFCRVQKLPKGRIGTIHLIKGIAEPQIVVHEAVHATMFYLRTLHPGVSVDSQMVPYEELIAYNVQTISEQVIKWLFEIGEFKKPV